jgi:PAS domain S-box-containing protein
MKRMSYLRRPAAGAIASTPVAVPSAPLQPVPSQDHEAAAGQLDHATGFPNIPPAIARLGSAIGERLGLLPLVQPNLELVSSLRSFARVAGIGVSATGALVLFGWAVGLAELTSISSGYVSMKPNTALGFALGGASLYVLSTGSPTTSLRFAALAAAFVIALIGLLTLSQYVYSWDLDIDQLLVSEPAAAAGTSSPGRMAPASALNFFVIGVSLLVLDARRCYPVAQLLTLVAALIALTALIGYVYGVESLYGWGSTTGMAIHSSVCFLLLSVGVLLSRQEHGLLVIITSNAAGGVMARRLLPAAIVIPLALGWLTVWGQRAGLHGPEFGAYLIVIWSIISFAALTWWNSGSLYRLDLERKRAEEAMVKGRTQLSEAQRIAHVGSAEWDVATNTVTWSDELYRILGYEPDAVEPGYDAFMQRVHPDDRKLVERTIAGSLRSGEPFAFDYRILRPDGTMRIVHGEGTIVLEEDGLPSRVLGTAQDITERKQIEYALRQNETRTRSIIDTAHDAFIAIDAAGVITDWNPQAEATFGWTRDEAVGQTLAEMIIPEEHREAHIEGLHRYVVSGEGTILNKRLELEALDRKGRRFPVEMTVSPIRWGRSHIFSAFIRDITDRKQSEEAIARQTDELTRMNAELEDFTHSVSHDLKEPLRGIEAFAGFLAEDYGEKLDEQGQRYVGILRDSAVRMKDLIDDLLQLSRIGRTRYEYASVPLRSLVEDIKLELSYAIQEKQADLQIDPALPTVACDKVRMREVFKNLISNAIKYNDKPAPRVEVGCRSENGTYTFVVSDNGIGIAPEFHEKIFKIFQRLHHREEYEGTGVGLAICKKVVEGHGGRIWVESAPQQGTAFLFTIPRVAVAQNKQEGQDGNHPGAV